MSVWVIKKLGLVANKGLRVFGQVLFYCYSVLVLPIANHLDGRDG